MANSCDAAAAQLVSLSSVNITVTYSMVSAPRTLPSLGKGKDQLRETHWAAAELKLFAIKPDYMTLV